MGDAASAREAHPAAHPRRRAGRVHTGSFAGTGDSVLQVWFVFRGSGTATGTWLLYDTVLRLLPEVKRVLGSFRTDPSKSCGPVGGWLPGFARSPPHSFECNPLIVSKQHMTKGREVITVPCPPPYLWAKRESILVVAKAGQPRL